MNRFLKNHLIVWLFAVAISLCFNFLTASAQEWKIVRQADWETSFNDVFFIDPNNGWAVGADGIIAHTTDGGQNWTKQNSGTRNHLWGVYFANSNEGWIAGDNSTILHTTNGGNTWIPQIAGVSDDFLAVYFANTSQGRILGYGGILLTSNGGITWTPVGVGGTYNLNLGMHFINANEGWIVGVDFETGGGSIFHTTNGGIAWTNQTSNVPNELRLYKFFFDVFFINGSQGWAVGSSGTILRTSDGGASWMAQNSGTTSFLNGVHFINASEGWVVGNDGTIIHTVDGGGIWSIQSSPTKNYLNKIYFVNSTTGWIAGNYGAMLNTTNGGYNWTLQTGGVSYYLNAVTFVNSNQGWAVGDDGTILRTTDSGFTWAVRPSGTLFDLEGVAFPDANNGWAVGNSGVILHTTDGGNSWIPQLSGTGEYLEEVYFINANEGWIVGDSGTILRTTDGGISWTAQNSGVEDSLYDVHFVDSKVGWAVGNSWVDYEVSGGTILKTTNGGISWTAQNSGVVTVLNNVFFIDSTKGWVTGDNGIILYTSNGGETWVAQDSSTGNFISGIHFINPTKGWAVGGNGIILHTTNGGNTWIAQNSGTNNSLYSVYAVDGKIWSVGGYGIVLRREEPPIVLSLPASVKGAPGATVKVLIDISDATGIANGSITVAYDANVLTATGANPTGLTTGFAITPDVSKTGEITVIFSRATEIPGGSGALLEISFTVKPVAIGSSSPLTLQNVSLKNVSGSDIYTTVENGNFSVQGVQGDVNNDGVVDVADAILILRIATGLVTPNDYQKSVGDLNGDKKIDSADATVILRKEIGLASPPLANLNQTPLVVSLPRVKATAGSVIRVPLWIDATSLQNSVTGMDFVLTYDPDVLSVASLTPTLSQREREHLPLREEAGGRGEYVEEGEIITANLSVPGQLSISAVNVNGFENSPVEITFNVLSDGQSVLHLKQISLYNLAAAPIPVIKKDGEFISPLAIPKITSLAQNFPNPFNPETWIPFQLAESADVTIKVYNVSGQLVRTLSLGRKEAGIYTSKQLAAYWDGKNEEGSAVASGVYFYQLSVGSFRAVKKMAVAK